MSAIASDNLHEPASLAVVDLHRISQAAMLQSVQEHEGDPSRASDFGRRARHWERLADAADALAAVLDGDESYSSGVPTG